MIPVSRREERITDGSSRRLALTLLVLVLGAVVAVGLTPMFGSKVVEDRAELAEVELGFPVAWMSQDQTGFDRPLPWTARLAAVSDNPVSIKPAGLLVDLAAALALELVVAGAVLLVLRRRE